jgi:hypothetical protein
MKSTQSKKSQGSVKNQNKSKKKKSSAPSNPSPQKSLAAAYATQSSGNSPVIKHGKNSCRIQHRELALTVISPSGTYDVGNLFICTQGITGNGLVVGKLWLEYDVEFFTPQLPSAGAPQPTTPALGGRMIAGGALSGANPMGTVPAINPLSSGINIDGASNVLVNQLGSYVLNAVTGGTGFTGAATPTIVAGAATLINSFGNINAAQTVAESTFTYEVTAPNTVFN